MPATQKNRPLAVDSPLGTDILLLRKMTASEELGRLFEYDLDLLSTNYAVDHNKILGQSMTVRLGTESGDRYFNGAVVSFAQVGTWGNYARYRAILKPWLWFLTRTADCRIFQEQTVPDIIKAIFRELGFSDFKESLSASYRTWDYCVQYRETDFNFVSRLMEREGIYYYFTHEDGKHTLVLSDSVTAHGKFSGYENISWFPPDQRARQQRDGIWDWTIASDVQTGAYAHTDYNFETPAADLQTRRQVADDYEQSTQEWFDYPGKYAQSSDGNQYAQVRIQELQAQRQTVRGEGDPRGLGVGYLFNLTDYPRDDQNQEYLVVSARYEMHSDEFESRQSTDLTGDLFHGEFTSIPSSQQFRVGSATRKPFVRGPQPAVVVGPSGKEIWTDKYGRIKVQFPWDRLGKNDENSSCWMRVAQHWGGQNWGFLFIPRIGQEVLVDFLEGDPDRPIITGRVYNANQMPPYELPDAETQSVLKTRSTPKGTADNFNELRFEDKKDSEEIYFHAERDFNRVVENNDTLKVGFDDKDKGDRTVEIFNNHSLTIGAGQGSADDGSQTIDVWNNRTETVQEGDESVTIKKGNRTVTIETGNDTHQIDKGNREVNIDKGDDALTVGTGKRTVTVESDDTHQINSGNRTVKIDKGDDALTIAQGSQTVELAQGDQTIKLAAGASTIEAAKSITLKVGPSSLTITNSGVTIEAAESIELKVGPNSIEMGILGITLKGLEVSTEGELKSSIKAPTTSVKGTMSLVLKGAMVEIN